ncbi:MAG TPA: hypothetical protein VHD32_01460 [Candidatus Didemnitutus sp.]|nr:hypothetical protein [Candidatus Didemnitutus sp.]
MKKIVVLMGLLALATWLQADPVAAPKTATPVKPAEKEEPPIPGIVIARSTGDGKQLGLTIVGGSFKLSFFDRKRKAIPVDVTRARLNWQSKQRAIPDQTVLNVLDGGKALGGGKPVRPPYVFVLRIALLNGEGNDEQAVENYVVNVTDDVLKLK